MAIRNNKQEIFCREYLIDLNATQAAIRAGYSEKAAAKTGAQLLDNPAISERIQELKIEREQRTGITAEQTLADMRELADMALGRTPTRKVVMVGGRPLEVEVSEVNIHSAVRALEALAKHQPDMGEALRVDHSGSVEHFLNSLAEHATSTPQGRIKARDGDGERHDEVRE